jgi:hypothetical protein
MLVPAILGSWAAITAVVAGLIFTGWCFVGPPGANFDAWMEFVFYNVIIAAGSGIPAGLIGLVVVKLASPSQPAKPAATEPQPADTRARPIDTAFQRLDKREPEN